MGSSISAAVCFSNIGKRISHEDNFVINGCYLKPEEQARMNDGRSFFIRDISDNNVCLYAVSDGMGGHRAGEVASRICAEMLSETLSILQQCTSVRQAVALMQHKIANMNRVICDVSHANEQCRGMGATLVMLIVCRGEYAVLNIGDSRAFYYNGRNLVQITKDHTEGQRMLDLGLLTRKELADFPAGKHLNRYFGYSGRGFTLQADEYYPAAENGIILLCSDGITDSVPEDQMLEILSAQNHLEEAGRQLTDRAVSAEHADNATVMIIKPGR